MGYLPHRRPSASMVVSVIALVVALSGTAVAMSNLVNGDKLIKQRSLSGNRLRSHTITGTQVNLGRLGKVPSAKNADHAVSADRATDALTAANAGIAGNANTLGGQSPSAFESSANWTRSGLVTANGGQSVTVASFGPFTLTLKCTDNGGGTFTADLQASTTEVNSEASGFLLSSTPTTLPSTSASSSSLFDVDVTVDFATASSKTYEAAVVAGVYFPGVTNHCFANALVGKS